MTSLKTYQSRKKTWREKPYLLNGDFKVSLTEVDRNNLFMKIER